MPTFVYAIIGAIIGVIVTKVLEKIEDKAAQKKLKEDFDHIQANVMKDLVEKKDAYEKEVKDEVAAHTMQLKSDLAALRNKYDTEE